MEEEFKLLSVFKETKISLQSPCWSTGTVILTYMRGEIILGNMIGERHSDGLEIGTMRASSAGKIINGVAGEVIVESLGKAKCELETKRISCV